MNFGEKLTNLRKQKGLSQEELGEELNVTRQTISKWELGQTSPDSAKLTEIANYFNVGVNELTNSEAIETKTYEDKDSGKSNKTILVVIIIAVVCALFIGILLFVLPFFKVFSIFDDTRDAMQNNMEQGLDIDKATDKFFNVVDKAKEEFDNKAENSKEEYNKLVAEAKEEFDNKTEKSNEEHNKFAFNMILKNAQGTQSKFMLSSYLDDVVASNKTNSSHIITVVYNETTTTEEDDIVEIKHSLNDKNQYEVSVDYDENGYINNVTIKDI